MCTTGRALGRVKHVTAVRVEREPEIKQISGKSGQCKRG